MSTRSRITIKKDGKSKSIYCHWDGYPSNQMPLLKNNYSTYEAAKTLINLGDISYLAPKPIPTPGSGHSFNNPEKDVVVAYHRDRGDKLWFDIGREEYNYFIDFDEENPEWKLE
jgi:hypothetical protein